ncbi:hypothetical protein BGZ95_012168 [Linnemannia exigua]|uniref:Uncharacterized protein n=1 Tax=Linnemannia exigua TaxID=604196 RepID=A0AAD4H4N0_9FUNG|nr:hypothetical protein BGZ95_012168 [Linnemannia exigua]
MTDNNVNNDKTKAAKISSLARLNILQGFALLGGKLPGEVVVSSSTNGSTTATDTASASESSSPSLGKEGRKEGEEGGETVVKKMATTTAMMPMGVVEWLLNVSYDKPYGFRPPAVEEKETKKGGDESASAEMVAAVAAVSAVAGGPEEAVVPQVPLSEQDSWPATNSIATSTPPTPESAVVPVVVVPGPEPAVATKIEAHPVVPVTIATVATTAAAASVNTPVNSKPTEAAPSFSSSSPSSSVLVNKVIEVRPSWDRQDQASNSNNNNNAQDSSRTVRQWPPRRQRQSESFTQTTITRPDGTIESKTVTFNRSTGVTETHTRIQRPDGSFLESSTHRINPSSYDPSLGQQQPSPQAMHEGGERNPYHNHLSRVAQQQSQQQGQQLAEIVAHAPLTPAPVLVAASSTTATDPARTTTTTTTTPTASTPPHRPSFKERWAQRRQEHREFLEELRAERERERPQQTTTTTTKEQQCEKGRRERRQELRDAEARQREATAAAYGFVPSSSPPSPSSASSSSSTTSSSSSNWSRFDRERDHHDHGRRRHHRKRHEEEDEGEEERGNNDVRSRSWPPKGYLRRQEREREEPRHNV